MFASTIYDLVIRHKNCNKFSHQSLIWKLWLFLPPAVPLPLLTAFSIYTNGQALFRTESSKNEIKCVHGVKVLSLLCIMLGHRFLLQFSLPVMNQTDFVEVKKLLFYERDDSFFFILKKGF